jgi:hypothetical protein
MTVLMCEQVPVSSSLPRRYASKAVWIGELAGSRFGICLVRHKYGVLMLWLILSFSLNGSLLIRRLLKSAARRELLIVSGVWA